MRPTNFKRSWPLYAVALVVLLVLMRLPDDDRVGVRAADAPPATQPATSQPSADYPAFHGGGPLIGLAPPIGPPPMALRWKYLVDDNDRTSVEAAPAIANGVVYVADTKGTLHAIDIKTGKATWTYKSGDSFETAPLVADGRVFVGDMNGVMHAVSAADGKKIWVYDSESAIHASANADGGNIYFGNDGAKIVCLNAVDGKVVWTGEAGDRLNSTPAIGHGAAFVSGCDQHLRAMSLKDGKELFSVDLGALAPGSPAVLSDRIVVGTDGGRLLCYSADGKKTLWTFEDVEDKAMVYSSPAVADGFAVVGARDRAVHAVNLETGKEAWSFKTRGDVDASPVISAGRVYAASRDKKLYVLDLKTGAKLWEYTAGRSINATPAIGEGVVIIADTAGGVFCLEPK